MNPRVKELAIEARLITVDGITRYALDHEFEKRFAELIVRECIDTAFHKGHPDLEFLLKHFGVEE